MRKLILVVIWVILINLSAGCASCDSYRDFLKQARENLAKDIRPKYEKGLKALDGHEAIRILLVKYKVPESEIAELELSPARDPLFTKNALGLVDDQIKSIDRILEASKEKE